MKAPASATASSATSSAARCWSIWSTAPQEDVKTAYKTIRSELALYDEALAEKPEIVVLNKIDALDADAIKDKLKVLKRVSQGRGADRSRASPARACARCSIRIIAILDADKAEIARGRAARGGARTGRRDGRRARALSAADGQDRLGAPRRRRDRHAAHRVARQALRRGHRGAQGAAAARSSSSRRAPSRSAAASSGSTRRTCRSSRARPRRAPGRSP